MQTCICNVQQSFDPMTVLAKRDFVLNLTSQQNTKGKKGYKETLCMWWNLDYLEQQKPWSFLLFLVCFTALALAFSMSTIFHTHNRKSWGQTILGDGRVLWLLWLWILEVFFILTVFFTRWQLTRGMVWTKNFGSLPDGVCVPNV